MSEQPMGKPAAGSAAVELLDPQVVEAALSVLARKTRAELMVGLLEDFVHGRRSGRLVLSEFRRAAEVLTPTSTAGLSDTTARTVEGVVGLAEAAQTGPRQSLDAARRAAGRGVPEWERLRQVGRDKGEPVPEWEIFHGLAAIAGRPSPTPRHGDTGLSVDALESSMDLAGPGGLGEHWSLHEYLVETRAKLGQYVRPRDPETLAATLLRIDAGRQLLKPGGLSFDLGLAEPAAEQRTIDVDTARQIMGAYRESLAPKLAAAASIDILRRGVPGRDGPADLNPDVDRALIAGEKIVAARQARDRADKARTRADELRDMRTASRGNALYWAGGGAAVAGTTTGLAVGLRADLAGLIGIVAGSANLFGRALSDWDKTKEPLIAPFRAWHTTRQADRAERAADRAVDNLFRTDRRADQRTDQPARRAGLRST
jgi:hypothetical protein